MLKKSILALLAATSFFAARAQKEGFSPVDYVNPLVGTQSSFELSTGNHRASVGYELLDSPNGRDGQRMAIRVHR